MKNYDKNSLTGFVLMFLILLIFNFYFLPTNEEISEKKDETKTENNISEPKSINTDKIELTIDEKEKKYGVFSNSAESEFNEYVLENDKIKVVVSNKGGRINSVTIKEGPNKKQYKTYDGNELEIFNSDSSIFNLNFSTGISINTKDLFFNPTQISKDEITMRLEVDSSHFIDFNYKLKEDYLVDFDINLIGMNEVIPNELNFMNLQWQMKTPQTEKSRENQDMYTGIYYQYFADKDDIDYLGYTNSDDIEKISNKLSWIAFQQQFFSSILVAENGIKALEILRSEKLDVPKPKIVLLDLNMPKMNGLEFLEVIREDEELQRLSVIMMTTSNEESDKIKAYNFNVAGYIIKPLSMDSFVNAVSTLNSYWTLCEFPD